MHAGNTFTASLRETPMNDLSLPPTAQAAYLGYVAPSYLQATAALADQVKRRSHDCMGIAPGHVVLDLGCGVGIDAIALQPRVGARGRVIGLDADAEMIAQARVAARQAGADIDFRVACADALPLADNSVDSARSERLFQHLQDAGRIAAELARVVRPGSCVVTVDSDWATLSIATREHDIERRLARFKAEAALRDGYAARNLQRTLRAAGLVDLQTELFPLHTTSWAVLRHAIDFTQLAAAAVSQGALQADEVRRLEADVEAAHAQGTFFGSLNLLIVTARVPL
jgi:ubiquinone/menaquinone biosynthesis C-methylase UbiE